MMQTVSSVLIPDLSSIVIEYLMPDEINDRTIGEFSLIDNLSEISDFNKFAEGLGRSYDTDFINEAILFTTLKFSERDKEPVLFREGGETFIRLDSRTHMYFFISNIFTYACSVNNRRVVDWLPKKSVSPYDGICIARKNGFLDLAKDIVFMYPHNENIWNMISVRNDVELAEFMFEIGASHSKAMDAAREYSSTDIIRFLNTKLQN